MKTQGACLRVLQQRLGSDGGGSQDGATDGVRPQELPERLLERNDLLAGAGVGGLPGWAVGREAGVVGQGGGGCRAGG